MMKSLVEMIVGFFKSSSQTEIDTVDRDIKIKDILSKKGEITLNFGEAKVKPFTILLKKDDFTRDKLIQFTQVAAYMSDKLFISSDKDSYNLNMGLRFKNDEIFITLSTYQKNLKFLVGNKLIFLFDNKYILELIITENGYRIDRDIEGIECETKIVISKEILNKLEINNIIKWRYVVSESKHIDGSFDKVKSKDFNDMCCYFSTILKKKYF